MVEHHCSFETILTDLIISSANGAFGDLGVVAALLVGRQAAGDYLAHCWSIFLKSSEYRHRNPNINIREIIWLGNQLVKSGPKLGANCVGSHGILYQVVGLHSHPWYIHNNRSGRSKIYISYWISKFH